MSAKKQSQTAEEESVFARIEKAAAGRTPIRVGVKLFESNRGNVIQGIYMGIRDVSREEMKDADITGDSRRKNIPTVYIRTSEYECYRTGNEGATQHFAVIEPGSYVRLECVQRGTKGESRSVFEVTMLYKPEDLAAEFLDPSDLISGFIG